MKNSNSTVPVAEYSVENTWDSNASQKGLERAADKIAAGIEKASGKMRMIPLTPYRKIPISSIRFRVVVV
jgi:hypothetical protein